MSFHIYFTNEDMIQGLQRIRVCVSNSGEEFRNTTVEELKRKLIPGDQLENTVLVNSDAKTLKKSRTLGFYGIKHEDHILAVRRGRPYNITVARVHVSPDFQVSLVPVSIERHFIEDDDDDDEEVPWTQSLHNFILLFYLIYGLLQLINNMLQLTLLGPEHRW
ncbi:uncharacterized protein LOC120474069 [Pimephales promelas]|uniref:uncharacterized protein LOC120474069 n=1 Tax=Pimephales promelas TaxID=90988 RepID=UPI001955D891|nr:uncharacterized protein LOC120474069 [Pimephales promelas]